MNKNLNVPRNESNQDDKEYNSTGYVFPAFVGVSILLFAYIIYRSKKSGSLSKFMNVFKPIASNSNEFELSEFSIVSSGSSKMGISINLPAESKADDIDHSFESIKNLSPSLIKSSEVLPPVDLISSENGLMNTTTNGISSAILNTDSDIPSPNKILDGIQPSSKLVKNLEKQQTLEDQTQMIESLTEELNEQIKNILDIKMENSRFTTTNSLKRDLNGPIESATKTSEKLRSHLEIFKTNFPEQFIDIQNSNNFIVMALLAQTNFAFAIEQLK